MRRTEIRRWFGVFAGVLGALAVVLLKNWRERSGADPDQSGVAQPDVKVHLITQAGDVESEDYGGNWADDGGSAPGRPGDEPEKLSAVPTAPKPAPGSNLSSSFRNRTS